MQNAGTASHRDRPPAASPAATSCRSPGPTNVPDRVLRAIALPTIDHRGPDFAALGREVLRQIRTIFKTEQPVIIYPVVRHRRLGSGTGQHALAGRPRADGRDRPLRHPVARDGGAPRRCKPEFLAGDWRHGADPAAIEARLAEDRGHAIKAVCVVHNETSTGVVSRIEEIRRAIDRAGHPALFMVDTISSLASIDYRHDEWGVDVTVGGSQKGLMLPPGLGFNAVSRQGAGGERERAAAALVLGLAGDARGQCQGLLPLHAGDQPDLRPARGDRDAARGRPRQRVRAPRAPRRGDPPGGQRLGPRDPVRGSARVLRLADRRGHAGGPQRRRPARTHPAGASTCRSATACPS